MNDEPNQQLITPPKPVAARRPRSLVPMDPLDRIADLLTRGITPDQLDKFLDVQKKYEAEQARREYVRAMAAFKAEPLERITKKKRVTLKLRAKVAGDSAPPPIVWKQETLAQVVNIVIPALARHGFSHSWVPSQDRNNNNIIGVRCVMTHELGHSEGIELFGLPDDSGQKNSLQQVRSTITYLQRATLLLITGLAAEDGSDDDGVGATGDTHVQHDDKATPKQVAFLRRKLTAASIDEAEFVKRLGDVASLEEVAFTRVNAVLEMIAREAAQA